MNLHSVVRGAITSLNPDVPALLERSAGYAAQPDGSRKPRYLQAQSVTIQVQPMSWGDIQHANFLNLKGVMRVVFGYGSTEGIVRPTEKGGDLLRFAAYRGQQMSEWLTSQTLEVFDSGWSKVIVVMQAQKPKSI